MSTSIAQAATPFAEDQLSEIRRLVGGATAEQRLWLSGYVAGFQAATDSPAAPAAPPAAKAKLTILYATESGNAEALAGAARKSAARLGFAARTVDMMDTTPEQLAGAEALLVIASTWGEGDPPQRAEGFLTALMAEDAPGLAGLRFAVLALGDRAYAKFCETGRQIDARLEALGGTRIAPRLDCDLDFHQPAAAWIDTTLREIAPPADEAGAAVIHVDFARPGAAEDRTRAFDAEITARIILNSSRSDVETHHVELSLAGAGIAYEPGDSLGFSPRNDPVLVEDVLRLAGLDGDAAMHAALTERLDITTLTRAQITDYAGLTGDAALRALAEDAIRAAEFLRDRQFVDLLAAAPHKLTGENLTNLLRPLPPRLYSVASSRAAVGEEAHLLIGAVRWNSHGRARNGVASVDVAERRGVGTTLPVYLKPNPHFRLPADPAAPIVMIGPGTGVAPFRAFLQQREATGATGRNWLFTGARRFTHDFLYQLEWRDWLQSGVLSRIDLAFSRDQRKKIYVQHRMWEARGDLFAWLQDGATVYVCGDAKAMAKDVHAMLLRVIADQSRRDADGAAAYLREMQRAGRYLRDVY
ncbi:MAG TPA: flavodoxin domain-containing protein [Acetobacteraceae bacterium]|nr:flavodoxin domain-containing protein [Acetobacteraceae bacterium]